MYDVDEAKRILDEFSKSSKWNFLSKYEHDSNDLIYRIIGIANAVKNQVAFEDDLFSLLHDLVYSEACWQLLTENKDEIESMRFRIRQVVDNADKNTIDKNNVITDVPKCAGFYWLSLNGKEWELVEFLFVPEACDSNKVMPCFRNVGTRMIFSIDDATGLRWVPVEKPSIP